MSRTIPSNIDADLDDAFVIPVFFVELDFDTDPLYVHTDIGDITVLSHTWQGTGGLGQISQIEENASGDSPGIKLRLQLTDESSGSIFQEITQQDFYQREAIIYFSTRDISTGALSDDPFELWRGKCDVPEIHLGERNSYVDLIVESEWIDGKRSNGALYSDAQLQAEYSGDLGFKYLAAMKNAKIVWGGKKTANLGGTTGGGNTGGGNDTFTNPRFRG